MRSGLPTLIGALCCVLLLTGVSVWMMQQAAAEAAADAAAESAAVLRAQEAQRHALAAEGLLRAARARMIERWREDLATHAGTLSAEARSAIEQSMLTLRQQQDATDHAAAQALLTAGAPADPPTAAGMSAAVLAVLAGGCVLAALVLVLWWRRQVQQPLAMLEQQARGAAAGAAMPRGAVAPLAQALHEVLAGLDAARAQLELRVDEKTRQLGEALEGQRAQSRRLSELLETLQATREQLLRHEKLAAVGTLAAGVAHEFNNILGGIRGCASEAGAENPAPSVRECLDMIQRACDRGRTIVSGLGQLGRQEAASAAVCRLAPVLSDVHQLVKSEAASRGVPLSATGCGDLCVAADPGAVQQMLLNLVRNAVQASEPGAPVEVLVQQRGGLVRVTVRDRGCGVPAECRARLFEPFFTLRERSGGTGLGLAITHGLAQQCGGATGYAPREGGGSEFWCELPAAAGPDP